jgi:hypothetical protein
MQRRDYGVFGVLVVVVSVFFVSFVVLDVSLPQPTKATLITQNVSRIAVSFFIDASLWVR